MSTEETAGSLLCTVVLNLLNSDIKKNKLFVIINSTKVVFLMRA